ncbi:MAG: hypothetical protein HY914_02460 [Desulfomonile tiedjei]|nr:hypothetical protein [Desulfomonile tiedjei]
MRIAMVIVVLVLAIIFFGGAVKLGSAPLFGHIDRVLGTTVLMELHYGVFSMIYRGERAVGQEYQKTRGTVDELEKKAEFGKTQKARQLERAGQH